MTIESLQIFSWISFGIAGIMAFGVVVLFFRWNICKIICELSGITHKKEIQRIYQKSRRSEKKIENLFETQEFEEKETVLLNVVPDTVLLEQDFFLEKELGFLGSLEGIE